MKNPVMDASNCPSNEMLQKLLDATLSTSDVETVGFHVETCSSCQSLLDELSSDPEIEDASRPLGVTPKRIPASHVSVSRCIERLGRYEIRRQIASGGSGVLYEAWDSDLGRAVALKVLRHEHASDVESQQRLRREARVTSQIRHDNVLPVYEFIPGNGNQLPSAIVMKLVSGRTLADFVSGKQRISPAKAARLTEQVARGIAAAHQAGLVHRDIKPSNLLVDDTNADRVLVSDFGLVRESDETSDLTQTGSLAGTPVYMSPEQIHDAKTIDGRSDIYSLGCVLYQLLTSQTPFAGTVRMVLWQILNEEPKSPRNLDDQIPIAIENVCLKAMSKDADHRYQTASEMADDLQRFLDGKPTIAKPVGSIARLRRVVRRYPVAAATLGVLMLSSLLIATITSVAAVRLAAANELSQRYARRSVKDRDVTLAAMETVVFTAYDELDADSYETEEVQIRLLEEAALSLEKIENQSDERLQRYRAELQSRLGQAFLRKGRWKPSLVHLSLAMDQINAMPPDVRDTKPIRYLLLSTLAAQGRVLFDMEKDRQMWPIVEQANELADQLLSDFADDYEVIELTSNVFFDYGLAVAEVDGQVVAIEHYVKALQSHHRIGTLETISYYQRVSRLQYQQEIAEAHFDVGDVALALDEFIRLQQWAEESFAIDREDDDPAALYESQDYLIAACSGIASCLASQEKFVEALQSIDKGWSVAASYLQQRPLDQVVMDLSDDLAKNAFSIAADAKSTEQRLAWAKRLLQLAEARHQANPNRSTEKQVTRAKRRLDSEANRP